MFNLVRNKNLDKCVECALIVSFCIYCFCMVFTYSAIFMIFDIAKVITNIVIKCTFVFLFLKLFYDFLRGKFSYKEIILDIIIGGVLSFSFLQSKTGMLLLIFLYVVAFKDIDKEIFVKYVFFTILLAIIMIVLSQIIVSSEIFDAVQIRYGIKKTRYALGFWYSAYIANHFLTILLLYMLLRKRISNIEYIVLIFVNVLLFIFTDTKFVFALVFITLMLRWIIDKNNNNKLYKIFSNVTILSFVIGFVLILVLTILYSKDFVIIKKINNILSGRLKLCYNGFETWGIHLFGCFTNMEVNSSNYNYVDPQYMCVLYNDGIVPLFISILFFTLYAHIVSKVKDKYMLLVLFIAALRTVFDPHLFTLHLNPISVLFMYYYKKYIFLNLDKP